MDIFLSIALVLALWIWWICVSGIISIWICFHLFFVKYSYERRIFMEIFLNGFFSYGRKYSYGNFLEWLLQRKFSKEYLLFNGFLSSFHLFFVVYYPIIFLPFLVKWVKLNWVWVLFVFNVKKLITCYQKLHFLTPW